MICQPNSFSGVAAEGVSTSADVKRARNPFKDVVDEEHYDDDEDISTDQEQHFEKFLSSFDVGEPARTITPRADVNGCGDISHLDDDDDDRGERASGSWDSDEDDDDDLFALSSSTRTEPLRGDVSEVTEDHLMTMAFNTVERAVSNPKSYVEMWKVAVQEEAQQVRNREKCLWTPGTTRLYPGRDGTTLDLEIPFDIFKGPFDTVRINVDIDGNAVEVDSVATRNRQAQFDIYALCSETLHNPVITIFPTTVPQRRCLEALFCCNKELDEKGHSAQLALLCDYQKHIIIGREEDAIITDPAFAKDPEYPAARKIIGGVVQMLKKTSPGIVVCQGPPGSGKTRLACQAAVTATLMRRGNKTVGLGKGVLYVAQGNAATAAGSFRAELAGLRVLKFISETVRQNSAEPDELDFWRILETEARKGSAEEVEWKALQARMKAASWKQKKKLRQELKLHEAMLLAKYTGRADVVVCTLSTAGALSDMDFDLTIIDEASQCAEPYLLPALRLSKIPRVLLVGDHKQLPPHVQDKLKLSRPELGVSLMERIARNGEEHIITLERSFRSNLSWPFNRNYTGVKAVGPSEPRLDPNMPEFFINARGSASGFAAADEPQVAIIEELLKVFTAQGVRPEEDILILTPFKAQRQLIADRLSSKYNIGSDGGRGGALEVKTFSSCEGDERQITILSIPGAGSQNGLLTGEPEANVALTRRQVQSIVISNGPALGQTGGVWADYYKHCSDNSLVLEGKDFWGSADARRHFLAVKRLDDSRAVASTSRGKLETPVNLVKDRKKLPEQIKIGAQGAVCATGGKRIATPGSDPQKCVKHTGGGENRGTAPNPGENEEQIGSKWLVDEQFENKNGSGCLVPRVSTRSGEVWVYNFRAVSFNLNGIRSTVDRRASVLRKLFNCGADVVALQELLCSNTEQLAALVGLANAKGYAVKVSLPVEGSREGVALLYRSDPSLGPIPLNYKTVVPGRLQMLEFGPPLNTTILNEYGVNRSEKNSQKAIEFDKNRTEAVASCTRSLLHCGDLNLSADHHESLNGNVPGCSAQDRKVLDDLLKQGKLIDAFSFHRKQQKQSETGHYTSFKMSPENRSFKKNHGARLDLTLWDANRKHEIAFSGIATDVGAAQHGDHAAVWIDLDIAPGVAVEHGENTSAVVQSCCPERAPPRPGKRSRVDKEELVRQAASVDKEEPAPDDKEQPASDAGEPEPIEKENPEAGTVAEVAFEDQEADEDEPLFDLDPQDVAASVAAVAPDLTLLEHGVRIPYTTIQTRWGDPGGGREIPMIICDKAGAENSTDICKTTLRVDCAGIATPLCQYKKTIGVDYRCAGPTRRGLNEKILSKIQEVIKEIGTNEYDAVVVNCRFCVHRAPSFAVCLKIGANKETVVASRELMMTIRPKSQDIFQQVESYIERHCGPPPGQTEDAQCNEGGEVAETTNLLLGDEDGFYADLGEGVDQWSTVAVGTVADAAASQPPEAPPRWEMVTETVGRVTTKFMRWHGEINSGIESHLEHFIEELFKEGKSAEKTTRALVNETLNVCVALAGRAGRGGAQLDESNPEWTHTESIPEILLQAYNAANEEEKMTPIADGKYEAHPRLAFKVITRSHSTVFEGGGHYSFKPGEDKVEIVYQNRRKPFVLTINVSDGEFTFKVGWNAEENAKPPPQGMFCDANGSNTGQKGPCVTTAPDQANRTAKPGRREPTEFEAQKTKPDEIDRGPFRHGWAGRMSSKK